MRYGKYIFIIMLFSFVTNKSFGQVMINSELENYFFNEILNGSTISINSNNKNEIYEYFGSPIDEIVEIEEDFRNSYEGIIETREMFSTGPIGERRIIYNDLIHIFAILKYRSGIYVEVYNGIEIINPLERLHTINIGDNVNKLIDVFGNRYYGSNDCIVYYSNLPKGFLFYLQNDIIVKIECIFFYYE